jgi:hypothetical protein
MRICERISRACLAGLAVAAALLVAARGADAVTLSNATALAPQNESQDQSSIDVGGQIGVVSKVRVTLNQVAVDVPADADVLLQAPAGQRGLILSDACAGGSFNPSSTFVFDDAAAATVPAGCGPNSPGGTFRPTDVDTGVDAFIVPPLVVGPFPATLAGFVGAAPNGTWTLYVFDDSDPLGTDVLIGGGWTLDLTSALPPEQAAKCPKGKVRKKGKCVKKKRKKKKKK